MAIFCKRASGLITPGFFVFKKWFFRELIYDYLLESPSSTGCLILFNTGKKVKTFSSRHKGNSGTTYIQKRLASSSYLFYKNRKNGNG